MPRGALSGALTRFLGRLRGLYRSLGLDKFAVLSDFCERGEGEGRMGGGRGGCTLGLRRRGHVRGVPAATAAAAFAAPATSSGGDMIPISMLYQCRCCINVDVPVLGRRDARNYVCSARYLVPGRPQRYIYIYDVGLSLCVCVCWYGVTGVGVWLCRLAVAYRI